MKQGIWTVTDNRRLTDNVYRMRLTGDASDVTAPGQFINIRLDGRFLRRPISVCDKDGDTLSIVFKTVGHGTEQLADAVPGTKLDILSGLGNGYDMSAAGARPLLLGGGAGVPPLYWLAKELRRSGRAVYVTLGFNTASEVFMEDDFSALGCLVTVTTADGSHGVRGFVTAAIPDDAAYFYACGPEPMLRAVYKATRTSGQFSFEERMGCGFGACMGCSCRTVTGYKRICRDGPVLRKEEILWDA